ncbi:MAG: hypothetical protein K2G85_01180 [Muribaculaceae bacterium]|nr:hypothetical protein [Muribaculaceae bacterium]
MTPLDNDELKRLLMAIGMKAYVEILFPAMITDRDISVTELCQKYPDFNRYTLKAQNTRRSKARKIFDNGWQFVALKTISLSSRTASDVREKAQELELKYIKIKS